VNYGHQIQQAIRMSGAKPVLVGTSDSCTIAEIADACAQEGATCLLLVSSRLTGAAEIDFGEAVLAAHSCGIDVIIDGAAQDFRIAELLATGADAVLVSGQKYLAGPTSGLVLGRPDLIAAVRAQEKGIGRGMKVSKEALLGVHAAVEFRQKLKLEDWVLTNRTKVDHAVGRLAAMPGVHAIAVSDPTGLPFDRVHVTVDCLALNGKRGCAAAVQIVADLKGGNPSIWAMDHKANNLDRPEIILELVQLSDAEIETILRRFDELLRSPSSR